MINLNASASREDDGVGFFKVNRQFESATLISGETWLSARDIFGFLLRVSWYYDEEILLILEDPHFMEELFMEGGCVDIEEHRT